MKALEFRSYVERRAKEIGLTMKQVAQKAGLSRSGMYQLLKEGNASETKLGTLVGLARALNVHPIALIKKLVVIRKDVNNQGTSKYFGDESVFVRDVTVPDDTFMPVNSEFEKIWEIQNIGFVPWKSRRLVCMNEQTVLVHIANERIKAIDISNLVPFENEVPIPDTLPGGAVQISVRFRAPALPCTAVSYWKMVDQAGNLCFPNIAGVWCKVQAF
jgi:transcriptional regulator with XRE-family HTH domain